MPDTISIRRINNCNVYINGNSLLGRAEEVKIPMLKAIMTEHKGLGMIGRVELFAGIDKLESEIKWASMYPEALGPMSDLFRSKFIQVRGSLELYTSAGRTAEVPAIYLMTAIFKDGGQPDFKVHENVDVTSTLTVLACQLTIMGLQMFKYDVMSNQYENEGVDMLAQFRANLGQ